MADEKLLRLWVDALRSGQYKQGNGALHPDPKTFCPLGVLCDIINPQWEQIVWVEHDGWFGTKKEHRGRFIWRGLPLNDRITTTLPDFITDILGINQKEIWWANDRDAKSFAQIADMIEEKYLNGN